MLIVSQWPVPTTLRVVAYSRKRLAAACKGQDVIINTRACSHNDVEVVRGVCARWWAWDSKLIDLEIMLEEL